MKSKQPHVNMNKTKLLVSSVGLDVLKKSGKYPCSSGVSSNSISVVAAQAVGLQEVQWHH